VKVIGMTDREYDYEDIGIGDIFTVSEVDDRDGDTWFEDNRKCLHASEYIVLVPTDVIHHDGKRWRWREVKRMAKVGECIMIVAPKDTCGDYSNGDVFTVSSVQRDGVDVVQPDHSKLSWMFHDEYRVLEPIDAPFFPLPSFPTCSPTPSDGDRIAALEKRVAELEKRPTVNVYDRVLAAEEVREHYEQSKPFYTREQVIDIAKRDIEILSARRDLHEEVHFVVNRGKRTIVALIRDPLYKTVLARGVAKCETGDCFNLTLGKCIALYRATCRAVPSYYTNAQQPTEAQVGDVVTWADRTRSYCVTRPWDGHTMDFFSLQSGYPFENYDAKYVEIVDDSHDYFGLDA
jgi:hypothetical protein